MFAVVQSYAQPLNISGIVTDEKSEPVIGATVVVKGTSAGTSTGINGDYDIQAPANGTLVISFIGMGSKEVPVNKRTRIDVTLSTSAQEIDDVVVTAFGTQKKVSVIGSISSIAPTKLRVGTTRSVANNLAGQLAGIIAVRPSGEPGYDDSQFWIRGISSFGGGSRTPLVLVDGIERHLNDIDAAEIESFSLLKDASASAMYGVRGANGVILINTKRGTVAPPSVDFRIETSIQSPTKLPQFLGAVEHMQLLNRLAVEDGRTALYSEEAINRTAAGYDPDLYPDVNWLDAITEDHSYNTRANLQVAGGTPMLRYSLVASYFTEKGIMAVDKTLPYNTGTNLNRYNLRANVDLDVTKTTLLRFNVGGYMQELRKMNHSTDEVFEHAFRLTPFIHPTIYSDGFIPKETLGVNPWAETTQTGYLRGISSKIESLISAEQDLKMLLEGLKAKATFSFDSWNSGTVTRAQTPTYYAPSTGRDPLTGELLHNAPLNEDGSEFLGHSSSGGYGNSSVYLEAILTYNRVFADKHAVDALFLYNQRSYDDGGIQPYRTQGIAGRLSYTFNSRYIGEFNFGYNGSENFAKGQRFGFFPSIAIGWFMSEESFMESIRGTLSKVKFRGSIGKVGNDQIGGGRRFAYLTTINAGAAGYDFGYTGNYWRGGVKEGDIGVRNLTWETVTKMNAGIELGLYNALELQVDVFKELRENIFMQRKTIPAQAGFVTTPWANFGKVDNRGVDMSLLFNKQINKDLFVSFRGNFTYARNKIVEYDEPKSVVGTFRSNTGLPINTLYGFEAERLFTEDDFDALGNLKSGIPQPELGSVVRPGDIKYVDRNNDGFITAEDEGFIGGTETPQIVYGFGGNMAWKDFDFGFFFQGTGETYRIVGSGEGVFIPGTGQGLHGNVYSNYTDAWTEENPSQDVFWPRLSYIPNNNNKVSSTWWKKNMSFLRLKTIELGYTLPQPLTQKIHASTVRFYVSGNDLFYFSEFKLWDPELGTNSGLRYPTMRSIMFGVNLHF
jgi:TonB-linked SusC/RagA family outer membrane protein